jgi:rRNA maturation RNase YbeY
MLDVTVANTHRTLRAPNARIRNAVRFVLKREGVSSADLAVVFVTSRRSRLLNREFLRHDYVTDVISFPLEEKPRIEGEIYVNLDRARQQAIRYGVGFVNEVFRLVIHGTLHLLGYDDTTKRSAEVMRERQERYVNSLQDRGR